jgi:hypothetical protein
MKPGKMKVGSMMDMQKPPGMPGKMPKAKRGKRKM